MHFSLPQKCSLKQAVRNFLGSTNEVICHMGSLLFGALWSSPLHARWDGDLWINKIGLNLKFTWLNFCYLAALNKICSLPSWSFNFIQKENVNQPILFKFPLSEVQQKEKYGQLWLCILTPPTDSVWRAEKASLG